MRIFKIEYDADREMNITIEFENDVLFKAQENNVLFYPSDDFYYENPIAGIFSKYINLKSFTGDVTHTPQLEIDLESGQKIKFSSSDYDDEMWFFKNGILRFEIRRSVSREQIAVQEKTGVSAVPLPEKCNLYANYYRFWAGSDIKCIREGDTIYTMAELLKQKQRPIGDAQVGCYGAEEAERVRLAVMKEWENMIGESTNHLPPMPPIS